MVQCDREAVGEEIVDADVIVPLMTRIDAPLLRRAARAKLILQFGVGVEGVDIQEVRGKISSEGGRLGASVLGKEWHR